MALVALAVVAVAAFVFWPRAQAQDATSTTSRASQLETLIGGKASESQRLAAIEELCTIDTSESRDALKNLADSS
jgi:hypothetical protein